MCVFNFQNLFFFKKKKNFFFFFFFFFFFIFLFILCPACKLFVCLAPFHLMVFIFSKSNNFLEVKGKNGSPKMARLQVICKAIFIIVFTRSASVLINFQGSVSAKYLFPTRAKFINSLKASRNLKLSRALEIFSGKRDISSRISISSLA